MKQSWITLLAIVLCALAAPASALVEVGPGLDRETIGRHLEYIEEPSGGMTFEQAVAASGWNSSPSDAINFGFTSSAYWFRFRVNNTTGAEKEFLFEISYP